jgi:hypothetical protein
MWIVPHDEILDPSTMGIFENNFYGVMMVYDVFNMTNYMNFDDPVSYEY